MWGRDLAGRGRRRRSIGVVLAVWLGCLGTAWGKPAAAPASQVPLATLPMGFEANVGQAAPEAGYLARGFGYTVFLTPQGATVSLLGPHGAGRGLSATGAAAVRLRLLGSSAHPAVSAAERLEGTSNYFLGNDPSHWHAAVPRYGQVRYQGVWPGIDLVYSGTQGRLKFDFVVSPAARPERVRFAVDGADRLRIDRHGDLVATVGSSEIRKPKPIIYQDGPHGRQLVDGRYVLLGDRTVGFRVGRYDHRRPLVIDPIVAFSSYYGGTGDETPYAVTVDSTDNVLLTGATTSTNLPNLAGYQGTNAGGTDAMVVKVTPGHTVSWATYLGGSGTDIASAIDVNSSGIYLCGETSSTNFPTASALQTTNRGNTDGFAVKLNLAGSGLVYSTYVGGSGTDRLRDLHVDSSGNAYLCGQSNSTDYPVQAAYQPARAGDFDGVISVLGPTGNALVFSTYLGGSFADDLTAIALDSGSNVVVCGNSVSTDFPVQAAAQGAYGGNGDIVVAKLNATGSSLTFSTYYGGSGVDTAGARVAIDPLDEIYVCGQTSSSLDFPTVNASQGTYGGGPTDGFVLNLASGGRPVRYATFVGGSGDDAVRSLGVDSAGQVTIVGYTSSTDINTTAPIQTANAGGRDLIVGRLGPLRGAKHFLTYYGGAGTDTAFDCAFDSRHRLYLVGQTDSANYPTASPFQATRAGGQEAVLTEFDQLVQQPDMQLGPVGGALLGQGVINSTGANQTLAAGMVVDKPATAQVRLQNSGTIIESFKLTAPASSNGWTLAYFDALAGGTDITAQMTGTGYQVINLGAGNTQDIRVEATPSSAVALGAQLSVPITGTSMGDSGVLDVVVLRVTRVDLPSVNYTNTPGWQSDGVQPDSGPVTTSFDFRATFVNPRGVMPTSIVLHLLRNGQDLTGTAGLPMSVFSGNDVTVGVIHRLMVNQANVPTLVKDGTYSYYVVASDGVSTAGGPLSTPNTGPTVVNSPPTATNVAIVPANPLQTQDLSISYNWSDVDSADVENGTQIAWTINGQPATGLADPRTLPASRLHMGDNIGCVVTPNDGVAPGTAVSAPAQRVQTRVLNLQPLGTVGVQGRTVQVTALLTDGSGNPVGGELVSFAVDNGRPATPTVITDANGRAVAAITMGLGPTTVVATSGGATASTVLQGRAQNTTSILLTPSRVTADQASDLLVVVRDTASLQPVANIAVTSTVTSGTATPMTVTAVTDGTGSARLTHTFGLGAAQVQFTAGDATLPATITAVAGSIARAQSTVVLDSARLPGDGTATVGLTVTLNDPNGNAVSGIPGTSLRVLSTPDAGLGFSFDNTDAQGVSHGRLTATRAGDTVLTVQALDPLNNQWTTITDSLALKVLNIFSLRLQPGLNLVGSPVVLDNPAATAVWQGLNPLRVARWLPDAATYRTINPIAPTSDFDLLTGRAFWVKVADNKTITLAGNPGATDTATVPLSGYDWTLATLPTVSPVAWDQRVLTVSVNNQQIGTLEATSEYIAPYAWLWNAGRQQYQLVVDASLGITGGSSIIPAGAGFWLRRGSRDAGNASVGLVFNLRQLTRAKSETGATPSATDWALHLVANTPGAAGAEATVGVAHRLSRALDIEQPPLPEGAAVTLAIVDGVSGRAYGGRLDPSPVGNTAREWRLRVNTAGVNGPVTLSWPSASRTLPSGYRATVTDLTTGRTISLRGRASLDFTATGDGAREFKLRLERVSGERLAVSVGGQPTRSRAAALTVTLNQPASLHVRVIGLGGRVVREWTVGPVAAGTSSVTWDGLDADGRRVPAGTYRLEARAEDEYGEAASAQTVVTLR